MPAVLELEQALTALVSVQVRPETIGDVIPQLQHARVTVLGIAQPKRKVIRLGINRHGFQPFAAPDAGIEQQK